MTDSPTTVPVEVIAHVISERTQVSDDYWGGVQSIIRLRPGLGPDTLTGLEEFSHLLVLWKFHLARAEDVHLGTRSPRGDSRWAPSGTFAHRNHRHPSQTGISAPRLIKIDGTDLHVVDLDAINGTPVLDILPWFDQFGPQGDRHQPPWPGEMLNQYWARPTE
ncbi:TrmO family methyltransferase [Streptacidiphilus sp. EB103A]|uniref:TrmO family methyltransferase domain-containing protein n=1 Tax=Streptacidiphilus sp. EB103A TaxID=3156275 RepID=UPI003514F3FF